MPSRARQHAGRRPRGIADLEVDLGRAGARPDPHVHDQPGLVEAVVRKRPADRLPHGTRGAVASHQVAGANFRRPFRTVDARGHPVGVSSQRLETPAQAHLDQRLRRQDVAKRGLQAGLVEHVAGGPAAGGLQVRREAHEQLTVGRAKFIGRDRDRMACDLVGDSELLEQPHDLVVEMHGARQRVDDGVAFDGDHRDAAPGKQGGHRRAHRSKTHYQDVAVEGVLCHVRPPRRRDCRSRPDFRSRRGLGRRP